MAIRLRPFRNPAFRTYYLAQMVAFIGNWAQETAKAFLALEMGGTAAALGSLLLSYALPALVLSLHGGVMADRIDTRKIIALARGLFACTSLGFFFLLQTDQLTLGWLYTFATLEGVFMAYDAPSYMATLQKVVPKKDFKMAVVLQSTNFHMSRALGPAIGGLIMSFLGIQWVFIFSALGFLTIARVVLNTPLRSAPNQGRIRNLRRFQGVSEMFEALRYLLERPSLRYKMLQFILTMATIIPVMHAIFRSYLKFKFDLSGEEFGALFAFPAVGSMAGALCFIVAKFKDPIRNLRFAVPLLIVSVGALPLVSSMSSVAVLLLLSGLFQYFSLNATTQSIHFQIDENFRGRLGSIISLCFTAITPLLSFPLSLYADHLGFEAAIFHPLALFSLVSFVLAVLHGKISLPRWRKSRRQRPPSDDIPPTTSNPYQ